MFRQQSIADPPAEDDVFRVPTFISMDLFLYLYREDKNYCNPVESRY